MQLDTCHIEQLNEDGWVLIEGVLSPKELEAARPGLEHYYPTVEAYYADPSQHTWLQDDMFAGVIWFPFTDAYLTALPFHPEIVAFVEAALGHQDIRFLRGDLQAKYAGAADYDQMLHFDYPNHNLVVPGQRPEDRQLGFFMYFSDVTEAHGPTHLVSKKHTRDLPVGFTHFFRDEASAQGPHFFKAAPELYEVEEPAVGPAGSLLVYDLAALHRSSRITAVEGTRLTLAFSYGGSDAWQGYQCWPRLGEDESLRKFLIQATPRQRSLLGFPPIEDPYWTEDTLIRVGARYPGMDMRPYRDAMA